MKKVLHLATVVLLSILAWVFGISSTAGMTAAACVLIFWVAALGVLSEFK